MGQCVCFFWSSNFETIHKLVVWSSPPASSDLHLLFIKGGSELSPALLPNSGTPSPTSLGLFSNHWSILQVSFYCFSLLSLFLYKFSSGKCPLLTKKRLLTAWWLVVILNRCFSVWTGTVENSDKETEGHPPARAIFCLQPCCSSSSSNIWSWHTHYLLKALKSLLLLKFQRAALDHSSAECSTNRNYNSGPWSTDLNFGRFE